VRPRRKTDQRSYLPIRLAPRAATARPEPELTDAAAGSAVDLANTDPAEFERKAAELFDQEDYAEAYRQAVRCIALDPPNDQCRRLIYWSSIHDGSFDRARPFLDVCLNSDPTDMDCLTGMAVGHLQEGDQDGARGFAKRIRQTDPDSIWRHYVDGQLAEHSGDLAAAIRHYDSACSAGEQSACSRASELKK